MAEEYAVQITGTGFIFDSGQFHGHAVVMSVGDQEVMPGNGNNIFSWKVGEEIIIA